MTAKILAFLTSLTKDNLNYEQIEQQASDLLDEHRDACRMHSKVVEAAREMYEKPSSDDIEIDDEPFFSESDNGTWVSAWLWVRHEEVDDDDAPDLPVAS